MRQGKLQIIGASSQKLRLSCEACGAHSMHDRDKVGRLVMCAVCGEYREIRERRRTDTGHVPERRVTVQAG